ncbi:UDP-N-acetylmuramoyl-tripeptide--D-alanyl-D-alanine ligase [Helicobacter sp. MIT 14-3879]|uniref:Mur ligase family protein n=1 Tax=Helicobacter sp. MIT 14-3879 TaxID=2040649 RepID=UPI000E1E3BC6|nr:UDP-N-acetylmuramoyl-tripeptide--D-alanyl-D-alanine ligase [Helicobacter sp. MIT 14-3879]RDU65471.1 UDP-MurNac-pentapeptide presynthetase MurF [Helicobacter sp. MIT 14-3879]
MENNILFHLLNLIFMLSLGFYLMQNLQWYNYSLIRIVTKHSKPYWHFIYLALPVILFFILGNYFYIYLIIHIALLVYWYYKLDKKLVWTNRIKRFFVTYIIFLVIDFVVIIITDMPDYFSFVALIIAMITSRVGEYAIMRQYRKLAEQKLSFMSNVKIIAITASYGKTSIKNFILAILNKQYNTYATPRSVNTINGIIDDINNNLPFSTDIYVVEAGARKSGDISKISNLLNHQYAVIGEIGEAHIEYFKNIENIKNTKYELLESKRLEKLFLYKDNETPPINSKIITFPPEIKDIKSDLFGSSFSIKLDDKFYEFSTNVLGEFNVINISVAILVAYSFKIDIKDIQKSVKNLTQVEHRLEKLELNGKIILDDSFNGNLNGMRESIRLSSLYKDGKKIIVTPGLVESNEENNRKLAKLIDNVFDIAIITGELNSKILAQNINKAQKIIIKDKVNLNNILASFSQRGDLILFANDAPNYI